ncbi:MAG: phosphodiesterase [Deltaproteobacteria bacterium]|nr:phosphodiesterase [Candidatus Anaeroferrophillus wilburensis]MBN2889756.1 phosphodiesterase [Deltaproteobacteria bacterium]
MKIGVISDTHGSASAWQQAVNGPFNDVDFVFHAGDVLYHGSRNPFPFGYQTSELADLLNSSPVPMLIAKGNCDSDVDQTVLNYPLQPVVFAQLEGVRFCVMHGDSGGLADLLRQGHRFQADFLITGHSHIRRLAKENSLIHINPGSAALPKDHINGSVAVVDSLQRTVAIIDLETGESLQHLTFSPR